MLAMLVLAAVLVGGARVAHFFTPHAGHTPAGTVASLNIGGAADADACHAPAQPAKPTNSHDPDWDCLFCQSLTGVGGAATLVGSVTFTIDTAAIGLIPRDGVHVIATRDVRTLGSRAPPARVI